ncbi:hypothetical protein MRX96_004904 [Rhipicephalus microplus]
MSPGLGKDQARSYVSLKGDRHRDHFEIRQECGREALFVYDSVLPCVHENALRGKRASRYGLCMAGQLARLVAQRPYPGSALLANVWRSGWQAGALCATDFLHCWDRFGSERVSKRELRADWTRMTYRGREESSFL